MWQLLKGKAWWMVIVLLKKNWRDQKANKKPPPPRSLSLFRSLFPWLSVCRLPWLSRLIVNRPGCMSVAIISWITAWLGNDRCRGRPLLIWEASVRLMDWSHSAETRMICQLLCVSSCFCKYLTGQTKGVCSAEQCPKVRKNNYRSLQGHLYFE